MVYFILALTSMVVGLMFMNKRIMKWLAERNGKATLEKMLFPNGCECRQHVVKVLKEITSNRISEDEAVDYFLKIKGLQVVNLTTPVGYWTRRYLMEATRVRLNYFEQVKFYETFLNFSPIECQQKTVNSSSLSSYPLTEATQELIRNPALSKALAFTSGE